MKENRSKILELDHARAWRTYVGGHQLNQMLGQNLDSHFPEEWIMSVVQARNTGREEITEGLSYLKGDPEVSLKYLLETDTEYYLGETGEQEEPGESEESGEPGKTDLGVLVKLIDAEERLTIQVHPTKAMAEKLFHSPYGKTESWYILDKPGESSVQPVIYLGFKEGVTREAWKKVFDEQNIQGMLDMMHCFPVKPGDMILIEGGVPHAIGEGCFLAEIQEPTDYTIRIERTTPQGFHIQDEMCHQGLGFETMFDCFVYQGYSEQEAKERWFIRPRKMDDCKSRLIGEPNTSLFSLNRICCSQMYDLDCGESFCGLYCLKGSGVFETPEETLPYKAPCQFFVAASLDKVRICPDSNTEILQFFGPMQCREL